MVRFVTADDSVAFIDDEGSVKVYDYSGNRLLKDQELPKVQSYLVGGSPIMVTNSNELASL